MPVDPRTQNSERSSTHVPSAPGCTILVIEDDPAVARLVGDVLSAARHRILYAANGTEAQAQIDRWRPELIILDLMLPDDDALVLCCTMREHTAVPMIVCADTRRPGAAFLALKLGADDVVVRPIEPAGLVARVEALLRQPPRRDTELEVQPAELGQLRIDDRRRRALLAGAVLQLTPTEFKLLAVLAGSPDTVVARDALAERVWGGPEASAGRTIDVHIGRLRRKLQRGERGGGPRIVAVRGSGYKLMLDAIAGDLAAAAG
ncbi:MAG: response regulator transcription factor [Chloroflexi bacterium]|nr:response regulator transcription factor [Chloroflexota bacterium]